MTNENETNANATETNEAPLGLEPLAEAEPEPPKVFHSRAKQGAMLENASAAFARAFLATASQVSFLLRKGAKLSFAGVEGEFVPVGRIAKRGAVNGTTYLFMRKLGDSNPNALYVYDWSRDFGAPPIAMVATTEAERASIGPVLRGILYSSEDYEAAGFKPPAEVAEAEKRLGKKDAAKNRNEVMAAILEELLSRAVSIHTLI
jgi:hypothetical protein